MSQYLYKLNAGDYISMRGPTGMHRYAAPGTFTVGKKGKVYSGIRRIGLLAGGTGITPMIQIANKVLSDPGEVCPVMCRLACAH